MSNVKCIDNNNDEKTKRLFCQSMTICSLFKAHRMFGCILLLFLDKSLVPEYVHFLDRLMSIEEEKESHFACINARSLLIKQSRQCHYPCSSKEEMSMLIIFSFILHQKSVQKQIINLPGTNNSVCLIKNSKNL